jgi:hypothetical protein
MTPANRAEFSAQQDNSLARWARCRSLSAIVNRLPA